MIFRSCDICDAYVPRHELQDGVCGRCWREHAREILDAMTGSGPRELLSTARWALENARRLGR